MCHVSASKQAMLLRALVYKLLDAESGCSPSEGMCTEPVTSYAPDLINHFSSYLRATDSILPDPTVEAKLYSLLRHRGRDLDCIPLKRLIQRLFGQLFLLQSTPKTMYSSFSSMPGSGTRNGLSSSGFHSDV
ncbi:unnamed protein product [Dicrocoelium dendriticum]|nr:unnamed protein product [Dicrocoelium dendriticum]